MWQPGDHRSMRDKTAPLQDTGRRCQLGADSKQGQGGKRRREEGIVPQKEWHRAGRHLQREKLTPRLPGNRQ